MKTITKSKAKKKAWSMFSKWVRLKARDSDDFITCYTCNRKMVFAEAQAGHGIPGRNNAVLFLEEVVKPQCIPCNIFKHGNLAIFTKKLILELGLEKYEELEALSRATVQFKTVDYQDKEMKYKALIQEYE